MMKYLKLRNHFLKLWRLWGGKPTKLPRFTGKTDAELVLEWIEALENHFECEKVLESQQVKLAKSKIKGATLTW